MASRSLGSYVIEGLTDGTAHLPDDFFGSGAAQGHDELLGPDGRLTLPIACFLVRSAERTILIDAGLGPRTIEFQPGPVALTLEGGDLPAALQRLGVDPADIDLVLLSHLHADHSGWVWHDDRPFFPHATIRFGRPEWTTFVEEGFPGTDAEAFRALAELGLIELLEGDAEILPGLSALHTPGHTPGHLSFVVSDGRQRAIFLGDAMGCPLQIERPELEAVADMDRALGAATRERILRELEGDDLVSGPHFPEVRLGRVMMGQGRRYWS